MTTSTREILLGAARAELTEKGWAATGLAIRNLAGVSQGSWAHAYPGGKQQVAQEIYATLHAELWRGTLDGLDVPIGAVAHRSLLKAMKSFLASVGRQPDKWRLLFQLEHGLSQKGLRTNFAPEEKRLRQKVELWAHRHTQLPKRHLPGPLVYPIVLGPALMTARGWLADPDGEEPVQWAKTLTDVAIAMLAEVASDTAKASRLQTH